MAEGAALIDASEERIIYANPALEAMFGYGRGELEGRPLAVLNAPDEQPPEETTARIAAEMAAHREWSGEVHSVKKDGTRFWRHATIASFDHPEHGEVWVSVLADITERKRMEDLKDQFFALVQHELRTPLTSIKGYVELLAQEHELAGGNGRDGQFLRVIERNANRLERLVDDLLFAAQLEAGELALERKNADLGAIAADCVEAALPHADEAGVRLVLDAEPVPGCTGDADRLGQAIDNLLSNAIKYTPREGTVALRVRHEGERLVVEVEDSGIGIAAADKDRLFDRFFRATTATERAIPGVGLGLSITKAIVEGHGGRIRCDSREGVGTTFRLELPSPQPAKRARDHSSLTSATKPGSPRPGGL
jgi:PAS domain S-box-containing protein